MSDQIKAADRDVPLYVRTTLAERRELDAAARASGLPVSTWLRVLGLSEAKRLAKGDK